MTDVFSFKALQKWTSRKKRANTALVTRVDLTAGKAGRLPRTVRNT